MIWKFGDQADSISRGLEFIFPDLDFSPEPQGGPDAGVF
jgi:hypothetical protein